MFFKMIKKIDGLGFFLMYFRKLRKSKDKPRLCKRMLKHRYMAVRWLALGELSKLNLLHLGEYVYYTDKQSIIRSLIVQKTKNIELLIDASIKDNKNIRYNAIKRICHLI